MKRLFLIMCLAMVAVVLPGIAAPIDCPTTGTVATLVGLNPTGCFINGLLFDNFTFTPSATGTGLLPTQAQVSYTLDNPGTSTGTGQLIYGFEFNPNLSVVGLGSEDILLGYTIVAPSLEISSLHVLETALVSGTGSTATVSEGPDCGKTTIGGGCTFLPTITVTPTSPHQDLLGIGPYIEIDVLKDINVTSTNEGGLAGISGVRDSVDLTGTTPEPATCAIVGAGLIGLAMLRRKKA